MGVGRKREHDFGQTRSIRIPQSIFGTVKTLTLMSCLLNVGHFLSYAILVLPTDVLST